MSSQVSRMRIAAIAVAALIISVFVAAPAQAAGLRFQVAPAGGSAGLWPVVSSIDPCPAGPAGWNAEVTLRVTAPSPVGGGVGADVEADGRWSAAFDPSALVSGPNVISATCVYYEPLPGAGRVQYPYDPVTYTVTGPAPTALASTTRIPYHGTLRVRSTTTPCPIGGQTVYVEVAPAGENRGSSWAGLSDSAGRWSVMVEGFASLNQSGPYEVRVRCVETRNSSPHWYGPGYASVSNQVYLSYKPIVVTMTSGDYLAMGDSYSSGEGAPSLSDPPFLIDASGNSTTDRCHRSKNAYPALLAGTVKTDLELKFVACSGATIGDVIHGKNGEASQINQLNNKTQLVSMTAGGNDLKFAEVAAACVLIARCQRTLDPGLSTLTLYTAPRLEDLYKQVVAKAPNAQIYVLGYPHFFSDSPSIICNGIDVTEARWMNDKVDALNAAIAGRISKVNNSRLHYVDVADAFAGKEMCSGATLPDVNGLIRAHLEYSFHPTGAGHAKLEGRLEAAVRTYGYGKAGTVTF